MLYLSCYLCDRILARGLRIPDRRQVEKILPSLDRSSPQNKQQNKRIKIISGIFLRIKIAFLSKLPLLP